MKKLASAFVILTLATIPANASDFKTHKSMNDKELGSVSAGMTASYLQGARIGYYTGRGRSLANPYSYYNSASYYGSDQFRRPAYGYVPSYSRLIGRYF